MFRFLTIPQVLCRRKKTLSFRKKKNLMKAKDRFATSKTGEAPLNEWFTKARIQKVLREVERLRNVNRHTIKFNKKLMKDYVEKSVQHSEFSLHNYLAEYRELRGNLDSVAEVEAEMGTLPKYLQDELKEDKREFDSAMDNEYLLKYYPQLIKILPPKLVDTVEAAGNIYEILVKDPEEVDQKNSVLDSR